MKLRLLIVMKPHYEDNMKELLRLILKDDWEDVAFKNADLTDVQSNIETINKEFSHILVKTCSNNGAGAKCVKFLLENFKGKVLEMYCCGGPVNAQNSMYLVNPNSLKSFLRINA